MKKFLFVIGLIAVFVIAFSFKNYSFQNPPPPPQMTTVYVTVGSLDCIGMQVNVIANGNLCAPQNYTGAGTYTFHIVASGTGTIHAFTTNSCCIFTTTDYTGYWYYTTPVYLTIHHLCNDN